jgi:hypothetical protein
MARFCVHGNEPSGFIKTGDFFTNSERITSACKSCIGKFQVNSRLAYQI